MSPKKTLRHYDEIGLLRPEHVAENGYRYYTVGQLRTMRLITRLKGYGFSLPEVAAALAGGNGQLAARLAEKQALLQAQAQQTRQTLLQLEQDINKLKRSMDIMEHQIEINTAELAPFQLFGVRRRIDVKDFPELFAQFYRALAARGLASTSPPMAFYHDEEFDPHNSDIEIAVQVSGSPEGAHPYPGGTHCYTVLAGPYDPEAFTATYAAMVKWIEENGYRMAGAPFDKYVRGGEGVPPEEYLTEIYFPIARA